MTTAPRVDTVVLMLELLGEPVPAERRGELPAEIVGLLLDGLRPRTGDGS